MKSLRFLIPSALSILFVFTGCATRYQVRLDALSELDGPHAIQGQTYRLVSDIAEVKESDLFFKEVVRHVHPILRQAGYRPVEEGGQPDLHIGIKAYVSDPMTESRQYSEPIYYDSPGYYGVVQVPIRDESGKVVRFAYTRYYSRGYTRFGGYLNHNVQYTVYDKVLELSARSVDGTRESVGELWSLKVTMRDRSTDYRSALPYLLVAAEPSIGRRTDGEEVITLVKDSPEIQAYKSQLGHGR